MADNIRAYLGTATLGDAPASATDIANYVLEVQGGWQREAVQRAATLGTDHRSQVPGVKFEPLNIRFASLSTALRAILVAKAEATTKQRLVYRANTGAKSADNPEMTYEFYLINTPTAPMSLTEEYVYETGQVECTYAKWDDGVTPVERGIVAV